MCRGAASGAGGGTPATRREMVPDTGSNRSLVLLPFSHTDSIPLPSWAMLVWLISLCEVQEVLHDGPVLDEECPHIPRPSPASLLTSKEYDGFPAARILWFLVILFGIWCRDLG